MTGIWFPQYLDDPRQLGEEETTYIIIPLPSDASYIELKVRGPRCEIVQGKIARQMDQPLDDIRFVHGSIAKAKKNEL